MESFKEFVKEDAGVVINKIGSRGYNGSIAWVSLKNSGVKDRSVFACDKEDIGFWGAADLKQVYRFWHNDDPNHGLPGGTGLMKIDATAGVLQFIDQKKYEDSGQKLFWGPKLKIKELTVFSNDFYKNQ